MKKNNLNILMNGIVFLAFPLCSYASPVTNPLDLKIVKDERLTESDQDFIEDLYQIDSDTHHPLSRIYRRLPDGSRAKLTFIPADCYRLTEDNQDFNAKNVVIRLKTPPEESGYKAHLDEYFYRCPIAINRETGLMVQYYQHDLSLVPSFKDMPAVSGNQFTIRGEDPTMFFDKEGRLGAMHSRWMILTFKSHNGVIELSSGIDHWTRTSIFAGVIFDQKGNITWAYVSKNSEFGGVTIPARSQISVIDGKVQILRIARLPWIDPPGGW